MDIRKLNEDIKALLEGDVVSFVDFKRQKMADRRKERSAEFLKQHGDELQAQLDKFNDSALVVTIDKIKVLWAEGPIKNPHYEPGEEFSYEAFQEDLWAKDYLNAIQEHYDKCEFEVFWTQNDELYNQSMKLRVTIGAGKDECNIYDTLELILDQKNDRRVMITNDPVKYNENYYKSLAKEYELNKQDEEPSIESNDVPQNKTEDTSYIKDYRKSAQDVAVGDIITCTWGYSMTIVDYYRVIERKPKSIKLEKLANKIISGSGYQGKCMPSNERDADRMQYKVEGKTFRITPPERQFSRDPLEQIVCQVDGHSCYYWDGKPDSYDHMD